MKFEQNGNTLKCLFDDVLHTEVCSRIAPELDEIIVQALKEFPDLQVEFDLRQTEYICSAFLRLCILQYKRVGKSRFRVTNASDDVREVFDIAALSESMLIE